MPIYDYCCPACHHMTEELFGGRHGPVPEELACERCERAATRQTTYRVQVIGPVSEHLEAANKLLLSPAQRRAGVELKTGKEIRRLEQERGLMRHDTSSPTIRQNLSDQMEDHYEIEQVGKRDGKDAAIEHVNRTDIQAASGLSDMEYHRFQEQSHAFETDIAANPQRYAEQLSTTAPLGRGGDALGSA